MIIDRRLLIYLSGFFSQVTWTVIITGQAADAQNGNNNVTYIYVDDSKGVTNINITMSTIKTLSLSKAANEKKVKNILAKMFYVGFVTSPLGSLLKKSETIVI